MTLSQGIQYRWLSAFPSFAGSFPWILGNLLWADIFPLCCRWKNLHADCVFAKLIFVGYLHKVNTSVYVIYSLFWWNSGKNTIEISHRYFMWVFMWPFSWCFSSFDFTLLGTGFPGGSTVKNLPGNAGDKGDEGLNPGSGRSLGEGNDNHSSILALENPMDSRAWQATVHGVSKSRTRLSDSTTTTTVLSCQGIFRWLPKHLCIFLPLVCILGTFKDLVPQVDCHFLLSGQYFPLPGWLPGSPSFPSPMSTPFFECWDPFSWFLAGNACYFLFFKKKKVKTILFSKTRVLFVWRERLSLNLFWCTQLLGECPTQNSCSVMGYSR